MFGNLTAITQRTTFPLVREMHNIHYIPRMCRLNLSTAIFANLFNLADELVLNMTLYPFSPSEDHFKHFLLKYFNSV